MIIDNRDSSAKNRRLACLLLALAAALVVLSWQAATVHFNYAGNWTALFMTGERLPPPPGLAAGTYVFKGSTGYDGQFYRDIAHAPWIRNDWVRYIDSARLRYNRILVPALAWLLAAGQDRFIDGAYVALILVWVFLGTYWLGLYALEKGHHWAWGLAFLLLPATLTSIDRMTVDVALAALCVAFVRCTKEHQGARLYVVLVLAALVRDTGAILAAAQCGYELAQKRWRRVLVFATATLPTAAWHIYLWWRVGAIAASRSSENLHGMVRWLFKYPGIGIVVKLFRPAHYPFTSLLNGVVRCADVLALCGLVVLFAAGLWSLRQLPWDVMQWAVLGFLVLELALSTPSFWSNVYSYGRAFSPLVFFATLRPLLRGEWWALVPVSLMALRIGIQMAPQAIGILHGILS